MSGQETAGWVLIFGTFDPLHEGHRDLFRQAKKYGRKLLVVVARDSVIRQEKKREPRQTAAGRLAAVQAEGLVDEARWGDEWPTKEPFRLLAELDFDVLALGYDQQPDDAMVRELLKRLKPEARLVRLNAYQPDQFKSSLQKG